MKESHKKLESSAVFKEWQAKAPKHTLAHAFLMMHKQMPAHWQFGYYDSAADTITTFLCGEVITANTASEAFKEPGSVILPLDISQVIISQDGAFQKSKLESDRLARNEPINSTIALLQTHKEFGTIWNITHITAAYKTVNVKIDAKTGEVRFANADSLLTLGKPLQE